MLKTIRMPKIMLGVFFFLPVYSITIFERNYSKQGSVCSMPVPLTKNSTVMNVSCGAFILINISEQVLEDEKKQGSYS